MNRSPFLDRMVRRITRQASVGTSADVTQALGETA